MDVVHLIVTINLPFLLFFKFQMPKLISSNSNPDWTHPDRHCPPTEFCLESAGVCHLHNLPRRVSLLSLLYFKPGHFSHHSFRAGKLMTITFSVKKLLLCTFLNYTIIANSRSTLGASYCDHFWTKRN